MKKNLRRCVQSSLFICLAVAVYGVAASAQTPTGGIESEKCAPGDPLCVEAPASKPKPGASAKALKAAIPVLASSKDESSEPFLDDDDLSAIPFGSTTFGGMRAKAVTKANCFSDYSAVVKNPASTHADYSRAYAKMVGCVDSCVSTSDATFLADCVNWTAFDAAKQNFGSPRDFQVLLSSCPVEKIHQGIVANTYKGTKTDPKNGSCTSESSAKLEEIQNFAKTQEEKFRTQGCPKTKEDYLKLKEYAVTLLTAGGKIETLPVVGSSLESGTGCGYSAKNGEFLVRAVSCSDENNCSDQIRPDSDVKCAKFARQNSADRFLFAQGTDCAGLDRRRRGDLLLMPIGKNVWIQLYRNGMGVKGINYVGLVFGKAK